MKFKEELNKLRAKMFQKSIQIKGVNIPIEEEDINWVMKIGMFIKLIMNQKLFHIRLNKHIEEEGDTINNFISREESDYMVFARAFMYVKDFDKNDFDALEALHSYNIITLSGALQHAIVHYEDLELYEICALLHKMKGLLKDN